MIDCRNDNVARTPSRHLSVYKSYILDEDDESNSVPLETGSVGT